MGTFEEIQFEDFQLPDHRMPPHIEGIQSIPLRLHQPDELNFYMVQEHELNELTEAQGVGEAQTFASTILGVAVSLSLTLGTVPTLPDRTYSVFFSLTLASWALFVFYANQWHKQKVRRGAILEKIMRRRRDSGGGRNEQHSTGSSSQGA